MADWTFDGTNKIIKEPVSTGDTTHDIKRDIYSAWKRWVQTGNGQYDAAFFIEGGTPIGATGLFTGATFILSNGWKLMAGDWDHLSFVSGNLFSDDGIDTVPNPDYSASLKTFGSVNAQGINTGGGIGTPAQVADAVWQSSYLGKTMQQIIDDIRLITNNKVTKSGEIITIYEDDGITIWKQYDLTAGERLPL
jgi:hypothetical protein